MRIFGAGATDAIGLPLVGALVAQNHAVFGMTRSAATRRLLEQTGATAAFPDGMNAQALEQPSAQPPPIASFT